MAIRVTCPDCGAALRLAQAVPEGKRIKCPKCEATFLPDEEPVEEAILTEPAPRRAAAARDDDDDDDRDEPRPARRKFKKKPQQGTNVALIVVPIVAGVLLLVGGVVALVLLWPSSNKNVANSTGPDAHPLAPANLPGDVAPGKPPKKKGTGGIGIEEGDIAKEISAEDIDGKKFKLSEYRGKVVLLDFWGNW